MVLKKKEIIAAALVVLIGTAGYLNWSYQDSIRVTDGDSYIETGKKLGEAQYVNSTEEVEENTDNEGEEETAEKNDKTEEDSAAVETVSDTGGYFEQAKLDRENARAKSLEILNSTAENASFDEEIRKKAGEQILNTASNLEKETEIESIAQSKGYSEICVYIDEERVNISVRKEGFADEDAVKLTDIATDRLQIPAKNVKIVEVK